MGKVGFSPKIWGKYIFLLFLPPKGTPLRQTGSFGTFRQRFR